jgi:cysteine synthase
VHLKNSEVSHLGVAENITDLVGGTPVLKLKRLVPPGSADIFAKLEYLNPGGSVKDRAAIGIIRRAEQEGKLAPGGTIVEATAGNTGIGLALIGVNRGYKVKLFVPENFSQEKVTIMQALGAQVERTPDEEGMQGAIRRAKELVASTVRSWLGSLRIRQIRITTTKPLRSNSSNKWTAKSMPWSWVAVPVEPLPAWLAI